MQTERSNQLLNLMTCLECLISRPDSEPIGASIAEGAALLLTKAPAERKELYDFISGLYRRRGNVTHGGATSVRELELVELTQVAYSLIQTMMDLCNRHQRREELRDEILALKFS